MLEFRNVVFQYDSEDFNIIDGLSFHLEKGEFVSVIGPSGCGKSTIFRLTNQLLPRRSGEILVDGKNIDGRRGYCGYMPQRDLLFPWRTVNENLRLPMEIRGGISRAEMDKRAAETLEHVGLAGWGDKRPEELSGGMRQRVVIAIAAACRPQILICDEPTTALDVTIQAQILQLIRDLQKELGMSVIYITHDLGVVANVADRVAVMYAGQIVEYGTVEEIFYDAWHPYTWALLQALPQLGTKGEALPTIDGTPPNLFNEIKGDAFAPRNKHALAIDFVAEPPFFQVSETHAAKTWYLDPRAPKMERPHSIQNLREKMGKMGGSNLNG